MFAVFAVCRKKARKAAEKKVDALRGKAAPTNAGEYEQKVAELLDGVFNKAKPTSVSGELATPEAAYQFIELAQKTQQYRGLRAMRKRPMLDENGQQKFTRGKQPRYEWVPLEKHFNPDEEYQQDNNYVF